MAALEQRISGLTALDRMGESKEIAQAALYLASTEASYVTGTEIVVDGGATGALVGGLVFRAA
jgi:NAD(P)-dependent dehydrogenase (short-subunit alcohol dehydrogenase family)